jgi:predicted permease
VDGLLKDTQHALRHLRKSPAFTCAAALILTIAIGANIAVFGLVSTLVLHPLPVPDSAQIYTIQEKQKGRIAISYPNYIDFRDHLSSFSGVSMFRIARIGLDTGKKVEPIWGYEASGNYFDVLGVKPAIGRFFHASDEHGINGSPFVVLSYRCWQTWFQGDSTIPGRVVRLNKQPYTVLGVAPKGFFGTERFIWPEVWVPIQNEPQIEGYNWIESRSTSNGWVFGRLRPGTSEARANAELDAIAAQLGREYPEVNRNLTLHLAKPGFLGDELGGPVRAFLFGLMFMAGLVLVAACTNLGSLYAARSLGRTREFGIRAALGSSRLRIIRQVALECILVSALGAMMALAAGIGLLHAVSSYQFPLDFPVRLLIEPGPGIYLLTCIVALFTGFLFSCIPAIGIWRSDPQQSIKAELGMNPAGVRVPLREILLGIQVAICCMLVSASFVSVRGLTKAVSAPLGVKPEGATLAVFDPHLANYTNSEVPDLQRRILNEMLRLPAVTAAAFANSTPLSVDQSSTGIFSSGTKAFTDENVKFYATYYETSPEYFKAAGTNLIAGHDFSWHDDSKSPPVAIVNETFGRRLFHSEQIVGRYFSANGREMKIVGVVEDGKYSSLTEEPTPVVFLPILQEPNTSTVIVVRSSLPPKAMVHLMEDAMARIDRDLPIFGVTAWQDSLNRMALFPARAATGVLSALAFLALTLSIAGISAQASHSVSKRMRELAIRKAVGASNLRTLTDGLGRTAVLLEISSLAGIAMALAAQHVLSSIVYHASSTDPAVLLATPVVMLLTGALSTVVPARKALLVSPAQLLREV